MQWLQHGTDWLLYIMWWLQHGTNWLQYISYYSIVQIDYSFLEIDCYITMLQPFEQNYKKKIKLKEKLFTFIKHFSC